MADVQQCSDEMENGDGDCDAMRPREENIDVKLKVGESLLTVQLHQLQSKPETMLGKMFTSGLAKANEKGDYELQNVEAKLLDAILDYYRKGFITIPENVCFEEMAEACEYLLIPFTLKTVQNLKMFFSLQADYTKRKLCDNLFENEVFPHLNEAAKRGATYCYVIFVKLTDREYAPPMLGRLSTALFFVPIDLFNIFIHFDDPDTGCIKTFLTSKGFSVKFETKVETFVNYRGIKSSVDYISGKFEW